MSGETEKVSVLIVGGGVVGLSAAMFLAGHGVKPLLIERHPSTCIHPRARGINPRTMEIMRSYNLEEAIRKGGESLRNARGIYEGTTMVDVVGRFRMKRPLVYYGCLLLSFLSFIFGVSYITFGLAGVTCVALALLLLAAWLGFYIWSIFRGKSSNGFITFCTQDIFEPILLSKITSLGVNFQFNTELVDVKQDESGVTARILHRLTGRHSLVHCQYLIAADGARSPMRTMLGIPFVGPPPLSRQLNLYFRSDLSHLTKNGLFSLCMIHQPNLRGLIVTINGKDLWTLHVAVGKDATPEDFSHEQCIQYIQSAVGIPNLQVELKGVMTWDSQVKVAATYSQGKIYFVGDAAHVMPPWGGFGANTGIQDAHNLCWKLAAVLNGESGEKILTTYELERQPVAADVTKIAGSMNDKYGLMSTSWLILFQMVKAAYYFAVGYGYSSSAVILEPGKPAPGPRTTDLCGRPGTRVPHVWLQIKGGKKMSSIDFCTKLTLFCGPAATHTKETVATVSKELGISLQILQSGADFDCRDKNLTTFGIAKDGALLVRPDGFVAWRIVSGNLLTHEKFKDILVKLYSRVQE